MLLLLTVDKNWLYAHILTINNYTIKQNNYLNTVNDLKFIG